LEKQIGKKMWFESKLKQMERKMRRNSNEETLYQKFQIKGNWNNASYFTSGNLKFFMRDMKT
jgi:hypothetical protein